MVTSLYLIRHCEAQGNIKEIFQGHTDGDITEKGEMQLEKLSLRCKEIPFDIIYTSPLIRAYKTAQAVNKFHNCKIIEEKGLIEIFGGDMEGHKWSDLPYLFPDIYSDWKNNFASFVAPNGEAVCDVYKRMSKTALHLAKENKGKSLALVSHGGAIFTFLAYATGIPASEISGKNFWCENTSISRIDINFIENNIKINPIYINSFEHLNDIDTMPHKMFWRKPK